LRERGGKQGQQFIYGINLKISRDIAREKNGPVAGVRKCRGKRVKVKNPVAGGGSTVEERDNAKPRRGCLSVKTPKISLCIRGGGGKRPGRLE